MELERGLAAGVGCSEAVKAYERYGFRTPRNFTMRGMGASARNGIGGNEDRNCSFPAPLPSFLARLRAAKLYLNIASLATGYNKAKGVWERPLRALFALSEQLRGTTEHRNSHAGQLKSLSGGQLAAGGLSILPHK